ncbi:uncharacterized protein LOC122070332 isoform X2 [Macadamia integrifolia]|uniref:uncharacterized protein LOC122070332 isoform X2 n=1 Tax=Macadamia integrifolia TaxID=60698 RepID=UPI001C501859|nr:uncharacterized protein LOC122070332 isoform X2 [Macadamia integrifolia]
MVKFTSSSAQCLLVKPQLSFTGSRLKVRMAASRSCCPNKKEDFINHQPMTMILHHCKQGNRVEIQFWEVYAYIWGFRKQAELTLIRHNMVQPVNLTSLTEHELSLLSVEVSGV